MRAAILTALLLAVLGVGYLFAPPSVPDRPPVLSAPPSIEVGYHAEHNVARTFASDIAPFRVWMDKGQMMNALQSAEGVAKPVAVNYISGQGPATGAVRRVQLEDGHFAFERVIENRFPEMFRYQIWGFTNGASRVARYAVGEFAYSQVKGGTKLTWRYRIRRSPRSCGHSSTAL